MIKRKTITFLILTFLWSWSFWFFGLNHLSDGITQETIGRFIIYFYVGVYGPSVAAILTSVFFNGLSGAMELIKKFLIWRVPLNVYMYVIFLPIIFVLTGIGLYSLFIGDVGSFNIMAFISIPTVLIAGFYAGPLGEELGWRGFLLPEFQKRYSSLKSAIIIGFIWFAWHIPLFWAPFGTLVSGEAVTFLPVFTYLIMLICLSIIITWLVNNSKGSVLIALLFHLSINAGIALLFFPELNIDFKTVHFLSSIAMLIFTGFLIWKNKLGSNTETV